MGFLSFFIFPQLPNIDRTRTIGKMLKYFQTDEHSPAPAAQAAPPLLRLALVSVIQQPKGESQAPPVSGTLSQPPDPHPGSGGRFQCCARILQTLSAATSPSGALGTW